MQINQVNMQVKWAFTFHIFSATTEYRKQVLHQKKYIIQWHKVYLFPIREFLFCFRGKKEIKKIHFVLNLKLFLWIQNCCYVTVRIENMWHVIRISLICSHVYYNLFSVWFICSSILSVILNEQMHVCFYVNNQLKMQWHILGQKKKRKNLHNTQKTHFLRHFEIWNVVLPVTKSQNY